MNNQELSPIVIEQVMERLRQERETFNQQKSHEERWFILRLVMGYSSVALLTSVMIIASYILINSASFSGTVVTAAGGALFVDVLGLLVSVWKIALNPNFLAKLSPVTQAELPDMKAIGKGQTSLD